MDNTIDSLDYGNYDELLLLADNLLEKKKALPTSQIEEGSILKTIEDVKYKIDMQKPMISKFNRAEFIGTYTKKFIPTNRKVYILQYSSDITMHSIFFEKHHGDKFQIRTFIKSIHPP